MRLANVPSETLLATRRLLEMATSQPLEAQLEDEADAMRAAASRPEFRQALARFLQR
jgi:enoyl-CoA hydratase/carnithine racemase